jgi:serine/threonine protein kinase
MLAGHIIDNRWKIIDRLGSGAHGTVFRAHSVTDHRDVVALKILQLGGLDEPGKRFTRAAQMLARIAHPNIVRFREARHESLPAYTVMELVEGLPLSTLLEGQAGRMPLEDVLNIGAQAASALAYLHKTLRICHRDLKPANIMLLDDGGALRVKLVDFGIALDLDSNASARLTRAGLLLGTLLYTPPEWGIDDTLDPYAWDAFSLGAVLFECLMGELPYFPRGTSLKRGKELLLLKDKRACMPLTPGPNYPPAFRTLMRDITQPQSASRLSDMAAIANALAKQQRQLAEAPPTLYHLRCLNGEQTSMTYPLRWGANPVGRDRKQPDSIDLTQQELNQPRRWVSRNHACINISGQGISIRDSNSTNGTHVNDAPLMPEQDYMIKPGDLIHLGRLTLTIS